MTPQERAQLVARDKKSVWHPYTPMESYRKSGKPLVVDRAIGSRIYDVDGRSIIDGNASWWTSLLGHNHPRLVEALRVQATRFCHISLAGITHEPAVQFAEAILERAPPTMEHVFFSDNGSTAVEAAIKLAVQYWAQLRGSTSRKLKFLSLKNAFHGDTLGATSLGGVEAFVAPFQALVMETTHLPSPAVDEQVAIEALSSILQESADQIAAFVVEPLIQGAGGMAMYSPNYLRKARELCSKHEVLFIVDEVFTGYGRTGKFWACDHANISPDILCTAKGLSGGLLPMGATLVSSQIFDAFLGDSSRAFYYGHTYCGNPLGTAVATEVLSVYKDEKILEGTVPRTELIRAAFDRMSRLDGVANSRSLGICGALDLSGGEGYLAPSGQDVFQLALSQGAYVRPLGNVIYITPPLNIPIEDLTELLSIVEESVRTVAQKRTRERT